MGHTGVVRTGSDLKQNSRKLTYLILKVRVSPGRQLWRARGTNTDNPKHTVDRGLLWAERFMGKVAVDLGGKKQMPSTGNHSGV